jgi:hypothetical protein
VKVVMVSAGRLAPRSRLFPGAAIKPTRNYKKLQGEEAIAGLEALHEMAKKK